MVKNTNQRSTFKKVSAIGNHTAIWYRQITPGARSSCVECRRSIAYWALNQEGICHSCSDAKRR